VLHAWCIDPQGSVLELTWDTPGNDYFGIPFRLRFLIEQLLKNMRYGLIDQYVDQFALVRGLYPQNEWLDRNALTRLSYSSTVNKRPRGQAGATPRKDSYEKV